MHEEMKNQKQKRVPAATVRGTYSTYENSKQRSFNNRLGNVVDFELEQLCTVEIGGWGSLLKIRCKPKVSAEVNIKDGLTTVYLQRHD